MQIDHLGIVVENDAVQAVENGLGVVVNIAVLRTYGVAACGRPPGPVLPRQALGWLDDHPDVER